VLAQDADVEIPAFNDTYSGYVRRLENGDTSINYTDFRNSFLDSKQFAKKGTNYRNLKEQVYAAIKDKDYKKVIKLTKTMLSIDYTSMFAHMYLQKTYKIIGDTNNSNKYKAVEFGLMNSILNSGDGKTCETGWHVTQIEEEYFILNIIGSDFKEQSTASGGKNMCDRMTVNTEDGQSRDYFFEANKVFAKEHEMFGGK